MLFEVLFDALLAVVLLPVVALFAAILFALVLFAVVALLPAVVLLAGVLWLFSSCGELGSLSVPKMHPWVIKKQAVRKGSVVR